MAGYVKVAILTIERKVIIKDVAINDYVPGDGLDIVFKHSEPYLVFDVLWPLNETKLVPVSILEGLQSIEELLFKRDIFLFKYLQDNQFRPAESECYIISSLGRLTQLL